MTVPVQEQLRTFATTLLERRGALVEWPAADRAGTAMLPPEVAAAVGTADDVVPVACEASTRACRQFGRRLPGMVRPAAGRRAQRRRLPRPRSVPQTQGFGRRHRPGVHMAECESEAPRRPRNHRRISHLVVPRRDQLGRAMGDVFLRFAQCGLGSGSRDSRSVGAVGTPTAA